MATQIDRVTLEAAAQWYTSLREATADSPLHNAHKEWLNQHPDHQRAWKRVQKFKETFSNTPSSFVRPTLDKVRSKRRNINKLISLMILFIGVTVFSQKFYSYDRLIADYSTGIGSYEEVTLSDGSTVKLNTDTAIDITFDEHTRRVILRRGEIYIQTSEDPSQRPLIVSTDQSEFRALGTKFLVRTDSYDKISVIKDAVEIYAVDNPKHKVIVNENYQAYIKNNEIADLQAISGRPDAWTQGLIIVNDWPLKRLIQELSRYHTGVITYDDSIAELRISGAFHLNDINAVLTNTASTLPVKLTRFTPYWLRLESLDQ